MKLINVGELFANYGKYVNKYIYLVGYYNNERLYADPNKDEAISIYCPPQANLSVSYYLQQLKLQNYEGSLRIVGMPGNKMYVTKNIDRIVKIEIINKNGDVMNSFINTKIPLPNELRDKI